MIEALADISWCSSDQFDWNSRRWADGSLLYNQHSGDTHYLDPLSMRVIELLKINSFSVDEIQLALMSESGKAIVIPDNKFALGALISDLERIGLIEVSP